MKTFESGARRSEQVSARYDLIPSVALRRLAARYALGTKYGEWNWTRGLPFSDTLNHIQAHLESAKTRYIECVRAAHGDPEEIARLLKQRFGTEDDDFAGAAWGCFALICLINDGALVPDQSWAGHALAPSEPTELDLRTFASRPDVQEAVRRTGYDVTHHGTVGQTGIRIARSVQHETARTRKAKKHGRRKVR